LTEKINANEYKSLSYLKVSDGGEKSFIKLTPGKNGGKFAEYFKRQIRVRRMDKGQIVLREDTKFMKKKSKKMRSRLFPEWVFTQGFEMKISFKQFCNFCTLAFAVFLQNFGLI
jgi:hypothetical protein